MPSLPRFAYFGVRIRVRTSSQRKIGCEHPRSVKTGAHNPATCCPQPLTKMMQSVVRLHLAASRRGPWATYLCWHTIRRTQRSQRGLIGRSRGFPTCRVRRVADAIGAAHALTTPPKDIAVCAFRVEVRSSPSPVRSTPLQVRSTRPGTSHRPSGARRSGDSMAQGLALSSHIVVLFQLEVPNGHNVSRNVAVPTAS
jgi:hypothetical protein